MNQTVDHIASKLIDAYKNIFADNEEVPAHIIEQGLSTFLCGVICSNDADVWTMMAANITHYTHVGLDRMFQHRAEQLSSMFDNQLKETA